MNSSSSNIMAMTIALGWLVFAIGELSASTFQVLSLATTIIIAVIGGYVTISVAKLGTKLKENTDVTTKVSSDVETVKKDVDGMKSKDAARIAELEREALALKQQLAEQKQERMLLAQSAAATVVAIQSPAAPQPPAAKVPVVSIDHAALVHLESIDESSAVTAANTKRTETKVDALTKPDV